MGLGVVSTDADAERDERALAKSVKVDLHNTDPSMWLALAASARALDDAGLRVRGTLRDRAGFVAAATRISPASVAEYRDSIEQGGLKRVSASAFARLVLNAPAGAVSRLLALRGPTTTLATDGTGGLLAFIYAADWLARRDDADVLLACGYDERSAQEEMTEGAACAVLRVCDDQSAPRVAATSCAGPGRADDAVAATLARARLSREDIDVWVRQDAPDRQAPSFRGALAWVEAARAVRGGAGAAVAVADSPSASCAALLTR